MPLHTKKVILRHITEKPLNQARNVYFFVRKGYIFSESNPTEREAIRLFFK
jgi:hypothetical protein